MSNEDFFTKEKFNEIREKILQLFDGELSDYFNIRKSTYNWSSKNNWTIDVEVTKKRSYYQKNLDVDNSPKNTLRIVNLLFQTMINFIEDKDNDFYFKNVESRANFGFNFRFLPKVIAAKKLLSNARF